MGRKIYLIRHGRTKGNLEGRYVGRTDESLDGTWLLGVRDRLKTGMKILEPVRAVYISPMKRCAETAELLFPQKPVSGIPRISVPDFRECDFGEFEYKTYEELSGDPAYQRFLRTLGESGFPKGEKTGDFKRRCATAFQRILAEEERQGNFSHEALVFVIHGGTIMAILEAFARPAGDYYSFQVGNLEGFCGNWDCEEHCLSDVAKFRVL